MGSCCLSRMLIAGMYSEVGWSNILCRVFVLWWRRLTCFVVGVVCFRELYGFVIAFVIILALVGCRFYSVQHVVKMYFSCYQVYTF